MPLATLPSKPEAPIAYELLNADAVGTGPLVVFINGLGLPASSWQRTVSLLQSSASTPAGKPAMLTYDRYGQGRTTARDPLDSRPGFDPAYGHDLADAAADLAELLQTIAPRGSSCLVLVAASIGAHIARLHAAKYSGTVAGLLLLDSNVSNQDITESWPDPDAPEFDEGRVVEADCSLEAYRAARLKLGSFLDAKAKNAEGLDRRNARTLLPEPDRPELLGPGARGPWLVVVGHDNMAFEIEGLRSLGTPRSATRKFTQPPWDEYNQGLTRLCATPERTGAVVFAKGCGHFIQKDDPGFVADQVEALLTKVRSSS